MQQSCWLVGWLSWKSELKFDEIVRIRKADEAMCIRVFVCVCDGVCTKVWLWERTSGLVGWTVKLSWYKRATENFFFFSVRNMDIVLYSHIFCLKFFLWTRYFFFSFSFFIIYVGDFSSLHPCNCIFFEFMISWRI